MSIDKCENTIVSGATNCVRIGNSIDSQFYVYSTLSAPILFGDNRSILLAPHNVGYPEMMNHIKRAKIETNMKNIHNFATPIEMTFVEKSHTIMAPKDFFKLVLPKKFQDSILSLTPEEFLQAI
jgi:hypothetical protein